MRLIDADEYTQEINNRIEAAIKWGTNAIADRNEEIRIRAEQAVATFCEASLTAKKMPTIAAEPIRHGEWVRKFGGFVNCSVCNVPPLLDGERKYVETPFCPSCGAKMEDTE